MRLRQGAVLLHALVKPQKRGDTALEFEHQFGATCAEVRARAQSISIGSNFILQRRHGAPQPSAAEVRDPDGAKHHRGLPASSLNTSSAETQFLRRT